MVMEQDSETNKNQTSPGITNINFLTNNPGKKITHSLNCVEVGYSLFIITNPENQIINQGKIMWIIHRQ